jgi:hypothetical protein
MVLPLQKVCPFRDSRWLYPARYFKFSVALNAFHMDNAGAGSCSYPVAVKFKSSKRK